VEAAVLCAMGAVLAIPFASWLLSGVRAFELPGGIDIDLLDLSMARGAWLMAGSAALAAACVITLLASVFGVAKNASAPQSRAIAARSPSRRRTRSALAVAQIAVTVVLATGAGLVMRSMIAALSLNPAFDATSIVTASISLAEHDYTTERSAAFFEELRDRLRQNGFIESA